MRKLIMIAAVALGSATLAASPAQSQIYVDSRTNAGVHVAFYDDDDWRWRDGRRWDRRWDRDDRRRWQRQRWRNARRFNRGWRSTYCRRVYWDGWGWRCVR